MPFSGGHPVWGRCFQNAVTLGESVTDIRILLQVELLGILKQKCLPFTNKFRFLVQFNSTNYSLFVLIAQMTESVKSLSLS